ncbi:uncharacterized protein LOC143894248 isoform X1 [Temnothorax americanus]|uniref:uncharacterized protein LOC143894248 isoform X1 n=1 Tax=Temnothorax americanus TaxID=1964332 RepID=UPI0040689313
MEVEKEGIVESRQRGDKEKKGEEEGRKTKGRPTKAEGLAKLRGRADSLGTGSIKDYIQKRKREGVEEEIAKAEKEILEKFNEARKVDRSPPNKIKKGEEEEESMAAEGIKEILRKLEEQEAERRKDKEKIKKEIRELKEEFKRREEILEQQKKSLEKRIKKVEEKIEKTELNIEDKSEGGYLMEKMKEMERNMEIAERRRRRNNIVVKGTAIGSEAGKKEKVEKMISEIKEMKITIEQVHEIGKGRNKMTVMKCKSWEDKREIMTKRKELGKKYKCYLDDDLTRLEGQIQKEIRRVAKEEREAGKKTTIGYQKMWVDNKKMKWNESKGKLEEESGFRK